MKKQSPIDSVSHKSIMIMIFMRTLLELCIKYDDNGNVKEHVLTPSAWIIYKRICELERTIYQKSKALKAKYIEAHEMSKPVWKASLDAMGDKYSIYIEPIVSTLYTEHEKELKRLGLLPAPFMALYDLYYAKHNCDLEVESVKPIDVIMKETEKALFEFKKNKKRENGLSKIL
jgi:hypothetical protein